MKNYIAISLLATTFGLPAHAVEVLNPTSPESAKLCSEIATQIVGKKESGAIKIVKDAGLAYRVAQRDAKHFALTFDFLDNRLNLVVTKKLVSKAYCG